MRGVGRARTNWPQDNPKGAPWDPSKITPEIWFDSRVGATVVSNAVSAWTNRGTGPNVSQATALLRPAYSASDSIEAGAPVVIGDGISQYLGAVSTLNTPGTGYTVMVRGHWLGSAPASYAAIIWLGSGTANGFLGRQGAPGIAGVNRNESAGFVVDTGSTPDTTNSHTYELHADYTAGTAVYMVDGVQQGSTGSYTGGAGTPLARLFYLFNYTSGYAANFAMRSIVARNVAMTAPQRALLRTYLAGLK